MIFEKSCGAVIFTLENETLKYLLIQDLEGTYGFPKGHVEKEETELETAIREIKEEVNLEVEIIDGFKEEISYVFSKNDNEICKSVVFFIGKSSGKTAIFQKEELTSVNFYSYDEALNLFQYSNTKKVLIKAHEFLKNKIN